MTFVTTKHPSNISPIRTGSCLNVSGTSKIDYEVGENTNNELFVRITGYSGGGTYNKRTEWYAIFDLAQLFTLANGSEIPPSKLEPFDSTCAATVKVGNKDMPAFLKAVLGNVLR
jgi:hypothetical protein